MKNWRVVFKRWSEVEKSFVWAEDKIEADRHQTTDCGVLEFCSDRRQELGSSSIHQSYLVKSIPPGCWMEVEEQK